MGLQNFKICFDNEAGIYYGGQTVTGRVELNLDSEKKIRGISISFKGEAYTNWNERNFESRIVSYGANENYFNTNYYLIGGTNDEEMNLPVGQHLYQFTCALPPILPSSFESEYGFVRYTVKVTLEQPSKFDQTVKAAFSVGCALDLNLNLRYREPATLTMEKHFYYCWCKSEPLTGVLKVPCTGFVSGQAIPFTLEIDNPSDTPTEGVRITLNKMVTYYSHVPEGSSIKKETTLSIHNMIHEVPKYGSYTFSNFLSVPPLPPSNLTNCNIIDIDYEIKVVIMVPPLYTDIYGNLPVVIGTIPLNNMVPMSSTAAGSTTADVASRPKPSVVVGWGPASTSDQSALPTPPPTYEESQYGAKTILDKSDSEHTRFNNDRQYFPMYPVYNFNTLSSAPQNESLSTSAKQ